LGDLAEFFCMMDTGDSDHCYQTVAVQKGEPETCEKVSGKDFGGYVNPPKDKCYLMIAENTGDLGACEKMEGGMMSYQPEECIEKVLQNGTPEKCAEVEDPQACRDAYAKHGRGCGEGYELKDGKCGLIPEKKPEVPGDDDDIESKVEGDLNTLADAAKGKYMELLEADIEGETDPARLAGLQAYKEFLEKSGETLETVQTSVDQLKEIKRIFLDSYDPSMDIDKMPVNKILDPGLFDKISSRLFGDDPPTARGQAEDALSVYEAMLKRQGEIDFLKKGRMERLGEVVTSKAKDEGTEKIKESVTGIAEGIAGTAFATVGIVDHALTSFKEGAQQEMFIGLAAAYNRQREAIAQSNPGLSPEEVHKRTVANVKANPYDDVTNLGFVKYGNILENPDCQDGSNPLCIDDRVFWTAMDKTWGYAHK
jgi:hypothetical protein